MTAIINRDGERLTDDKGRLFSGRDARRDTGPIPRTLEELVADEPLVEYQVYDDDQHANIPAYRGFDKAEAERVAATLTNPEVFTTIRSAA